MRADTLPAVTVIIAVRNNLADLERCLPSIAADRSIRCEVVIVDNGSSDGTRERIHEFRPTPRLIANATNLGHCRAVNQGLAVANGDFIVVADADTIFAGDAIGQLARFMAATPQAAIVAPRMLNVDGSVQETARRFPRPINGMFGRQSLLTRWVPNNRFSNAYLQRADLTREAPFAVDWVSAACMMFRRTLPRVLGSWDEGYGGYWVDADWCQRAHSVGRIYCVPTARVTHVEQNRSGVKRDPRRIVQFHAGAYRFYRKHYTAGWYDPRALATAAALGARAGSLLIANALRPASPAPRAVAPQAGGPQRSETDTENVHA